MALSENWLPQNLMVIMISYFSHKKLTVSWGLIPSLQTNLDEASRAPFPFGSRWKVHWTNETFESSMGEKPQKELQKVWMKSGVVQKKTSWNTT